MTKGIDQCLFEYRFRNFQHFLSRPSSFDNITEVEFGQYIGIGLFVLTGEIAIIGLVVKYLIFIRALKQYATGDCLLIKMLSVFRKKENGGTFELITSCRQI